jgi:polar amino acid transport system substrate-binding protein
MRLGRRDLSSFGAVAAATAAIAATASSEAQAQNAGSAWQTIRSRKIVRVGVTPSEPWYAKDLTNGTWTGVGSILGQRLAHDMDCEAEFVETTWANAPAGLQAGQFDIMFVLDPTPARAMSIDFPFAPVLYYALGFMTKDPSPAKTWAELDTPDATIAVPLGTAMDRWLSHNVTHAAITRLPTIDETILHYQSGHSKVLVLYHPALIAYRLRIGTGTVVVPRPAVTSIAGAGIRREPDKDWRDYLTSVLTFYYENGTVDDMYRTYLASRGLDPASLPGITKSALERA